MRHYHPPDLENDATIKDIVDNLTNPAEYVRRVLENMWSYRGPASGGQRPKNVSVEIGITGAGHAPHYRIRSSSSPSIVYYNGSSHRPIQGGLVIAHPADFGMANLQLLTGLAQGRAGALDVGFWWTGPTISCIGGRLVCQPREQLRGLTRVIGRRMPDERFLIRKHWSSRSMTIDEVKDLLGSLRTKYNK